MRKDALVLISVLLGASLLLWSPVQGAPKQDAKATVPHPGCTVWWFIHGCPLARVFGVDPFHLYPWEKFCRKYPAAFGDIPECDKFMQTIKAGKIEEEKAKAEAEAEAEASSVAELSLIHI